MHTIWLAKLDYEQDGFAIAAIRGVRHIWTGLNHVHTFKDAKAVVDRFITEPTRMVPVAEGENYDDLHDLMVAAAEAHLGAAEFVIDPENTSVTVEEPEEEDFEGVFSPAAYKTALILINIGPQPMAAITHAVALARATEDVNLYQEVVAVIADTFELPLSLGNGEDGPEIQIFGENG